MFDMTDESPGRARAIDIEAQACVVSEDDLPLRARIDAERRPTRDKAATGQRSSPWDEVRQRGGMVPPEFGQNASRSSLGLYPNNQTFVDLDDIDSMPAVLPRDVPRRRLQHQPFASPTPWNDAIDLDDINEKEYQETADGRIQVDLDDYEDVIRPDIPIERGRRNARKGAPEPKAREVLPELLHSGLRLRPGKAVELKNGTTLADNTLLVCGYFLRIKVIFRRGDRCFIRGQLFRRNRELYGTIPRTFGEVSCLQEVAEADVKDVVRIRQLRLTNLPGLEGRISRSDAQDEAAGLLLCRWKMNILDNVEGGSAAAQLGEFGHIRRLNEHEVDDGMYRVGDMHLTELWRGAARQKQLLESGPQARTLTLDEDDLTEIQAEPVLPSPSYCHENVHLSSRHPSGNGVEDSEMTDEQYARSLHELWQREDATPPLLSFRPRNSSQVGQSLATHLQVPDRSSASPSNFGTGISSFRQSMTRNANSVPSSPSRRPTALVSNDRSIRVVDLTDAAEHEHNDQLQVPDRIGSVGKRHRTDSRNSPGTPSGSPKRHQSRSPRNQYSPMRRPSYTRDMSTQNTPTKAGNTTVDFSSPTNSTARSSASPRHHHLAVDIIDEEENSSSASSYTFGDTFCGGGGVSAGARTAGLKIMFGFDKDETAILTWAKNFGVSKAHHCDAHSFVTNKYVPDRRRFVDILHASPPCQPFSWAKTTPGKDDEINEAGMFAVVELLKFARPRVVTVEQTDGMFFISGHSYHFMKLVEEFTSMGYSVRWGILHAINYGVPSRRKRLILMASCPGERLPDLPKPTHHDPFVPNPSMATFLANLPTVPTLGQALASIPPWAEDQTSNPLPKPQITSLHDVNRPLGRTIMASGGSYDIHPNGLRKFTVRELASISTFPSTHLFHGSNTAKKKQIGNAVPPKMAEAILRSAVRSLEIVDREKAGLDIL